MRIVGGVLVPGQAVVAKKLSVVNSQAPVGQIAELRTMGQNNHELILNGMTIAPGDFPGLICKFCSQHATQLEWEEILSTETVEEADA